MDDDILKTVHSMFGKSVQIVDCEKTSSVQQEEVLLINGIPVSLDGHAGEEIKSSLLTGQMPSVELLNELLYQAGILKQSVQLETSLSVKSSMITTEEVSVERGGEIVDGRTSETKEDYTYSSSKKEIWNPIKATNTNKAATEAMSNTPKVLFESKEPCRPTSSTSISKSSGIFEKDCYPTFDSQHHSNLSCQDVGDNDDDDDDDDDDNDEDGELYVLNPIQYNQSEASTSLSASRQLLNSATNTISSSSTAAVIQSYDILRKCHPDTSQRERKSSSLSIDSGHDGAFHSPSQQAYNNNQSVSTSIQSQLTTNNTDHSISSCYEFTSSDEAEFLTLTNDCTSCLGKYCDSNHPPIKYRGCDDLKQRINLLPNISQSSHDKNAKSPILGTKLSMSSSSCSSKSKPLSSQPKQQNEADSTSISNTVKPSPSYSTTTNQLHPEQPVTSASSSAVSVENGLVFRNGNLLSGPLEALIAHMVPSATYYPDRSFIFSFLLSARLFIRPHELLSRISFIWENQWQQQLSLDVVDEKYTPYSDQHSQQAICGGSSGKLQMFQFTDEQTHHKAIKSAQNCIQLLSEWIDTFPYDFRDERLMQHVRVLARKCVFIDNRLGKRVSSILQQLVQRLTVLEKYEEFLQTLTAKEALEQQQNQTTNEDITASTYQKSLHPSTSHGGGHTNSGYVHAISTSTSQNNDQVDETISKDNSEALRYCSLDSGCSHKTLPSAYTTAPGTCHPNKFANNPHHNHQHHQQLHNFHQSDISSNSVNTVGPGSGIAGLGLGISGCTSSNSSGISCGAELIGICDLCPNAALLAHQLTHIELERLSHIGPEEFVQAFAKENHLESFSDMKKTRNLESYVEWFNRLSYFTATEIVKYPKKKQRVRIIEFWIETARECFNIGNFNSLMAIIAGLNLSPISRLKKTWSKIQSAKFSVLEHQMDPTSNFNSYRSTLKAAMWRSEGATNERERIIIPFFSLLVKDLYFLNEGCSNRLPNGHINFEKFWQLAKQVMEFNTWKKVTCPFEKLPNVIMFLQSSTVFNENTLSIASFECEPPENTQEKGRYKTLKSETKQQQQQT